MPAALPSVWPKCRRTLKAFVPWWTSQEADTATFPAHTTAWIQQTSQWIWTSQHPEVKFAHRKWILLSSPEAVSGGEARKPFNPSWHTPWAGCKKDGLVMLAPWWHQFHDPQSVDLATKKSYQLQQISLRSFASCLPKRLRRCPPSLKYVFLEGDLVTLLCSSSVLYFYFFERC